MERLESVLERNRRRILGHEDVAGVGIGRQHADGCSSGQSSLILFVKQQVSLADLSRSGFIPSEISPASLEVVEVGEFVAYGISENGTSPRDRETNKRDRLRTLLGRFLPSRR
ncbi:MAG: hypothetical protein AB1497_12225 [Bacillota bacterium]